MTKNGGQGVRQPRGRELFILSLVLATLINVNFSILRSAKAALVVTAENGGAEMVPVLHLWAVLPAAVAVAWLLSRLLRRYSLAGVFPWVTGSFLLFFLLFAFVLFPHRDLLHSALGLGAIAARLNSWGFFRIGFLVQSWSYTLFYVVSELWKVAVLTVLFFGFLNTLYQLPTAKRLYGPLMLGGSLGALIAGPIVRFCCVESATWEWALQRQMIFVAVFGVAILVGFAALVRRHGQQPADRRVPLKVSQNFSLGSALRTFFRSRYLLGLGLIVLADYVVYSLGELVLLDRLHAAYPDPASYCALFGRLTFWAGLLTGVGALLVAPLLLSRFSWVVTAVATPLVLLLTVGSFFALVWAGNGIAGPALLHATVVVGGAQFCCCRAAKYTLFDTSKELAFVVLAPEEQMQGKLVIDGVGARFGRAAAAAISMSLVSMFGSIVSAAPAAALIALGALCVWISTVCIVSRQFEVLSGNKRLFRV